MGTQVRYILITYSSFVFLFLHCTTKISMTFKFFYFKAYLHTVWRSIAFILVYAVHIAITYFVQQRVVEFKSALDSSIYTVLF